MKASQAESEDLHRLRARILRLRERGLAPMEVVMAPQTWERLKRQYCARTPGLKPKVISSREVLGLRNRLTPGAQGVIIRYFGGADLPPDPDVEDGFIDLAQLELVQVRRSENDGGAAQ